MRAPGREGWGRQKVLLGGWRYREVCFCFVKVPVPLPVPEPTSQHSNNPREGEWRKVCVVAGEGQKEKEHQ